MTNPSIGRIVVYTFDGQGVKDVAEQRANRVGFKGNVEVVGSQRPMIITQVWENGTVSGQVFLDGNDIFWVSSKDQKDDGTHGTFKFPVKSPDVVTNPANTTDQTGETRASFLSRQIAQKNK